MFRFRRYRYYVFFAAIVVFLLYRVAQNSEQWEAVSASFPHVGPPSGSKLPPVIKPGADSQAGVSSNSISSEDDDLPQQILNIPTKDVPPVKLPEPKSVHKPADDNDDDENGDNDIELSPQSDTAVKEAGVLAYDHDEAAKATTAPVINMPDKSVGQGAKDANQKPIKVGSGGIHWERVAEHFPVPASEMIPLPTGKPKKIPTIQYAFEKESSESREKREARQQLVKAEMERSWAGYWKYAKGHDELSPVTKRFRDPFCGWAATLVDSLDTLWIMGMQEEFEEALLEVEKIDFTVSTRTEIPVFETTIRYLGGFIAAYDVSSSKSGSYDILLEKAVELAEILMGVFDTPNRMPVLYYNWKPQYASQPRRAGNRVSVAELGSLAMEFTRLAQLTKENKYYDAVARITDAFYEWQEMGTSVPGIFPENVDASGCNRTAQNELEAAQSAGDDEAEDELDLESDKSGSHFVKRSGKSTALNLNVVKKKKDPKTGRVQIIAGERSLPECVSQGLTSAGWGSEQYSMGGSQDSTYEYFPKQWLLLGGLEPKYKELHLKVSEAVKKWLLFRPMVPDDRDILFSGKLITSGEPEIDAKKQYEVTHLTCFIGGMFGMGGKIFEIPADVEIGKKLTEGCVWAYESTATGIMPEGAHVLPCSDAKNCPWNQTRYDQALDPMFDSRDEQIQEYYKKKKEDAKKESARGRTSSTSESKRPKKSTFDESSDDFEGDDGYPAVRKRAPTSKEDLAEDLEDSDPAPGFKKSTAGQVPLQEDEDEDEDEDIYEEDPRRPLSHEEFVANKIANQGLPKGFVDVTSRAYILRQVKLPSR